MVAQDLQGRIQHLRTPITRTLWEVEGTHPVTCSNGYANGYGDANGNSNLNATVGFDANDNANGTGHANGNAMLVLIAMAMVMPFTP